jgi:2-dehydropantoate 2-reductase
VSDTIAVLGVGAVGLAVAARAAAAGERVICICREGTAAAIRERGVAAETSAGVIHAHPDVTEHLAEPVSLLVVAVKSPALAEALERVDPAAMDDGVVLSLLNGLEHPAVIRRSLGSRVAPGTIARFSSEHRAPGRALERTGTPLVTVALGDLSRAAVERAVQPLVAGGIDVVVADDETAVLWEKTARLGPLAAATAASGLTVGELRADASWRARLDAALFEAATVAAADGVPLETADQWAIIDAMPAAASTSTAFDIARGRPSELDAIAGSVLRAAARLGVACPTLAALVVQAEPGR